MSHEFPHITILGGTDGFGLWLARTIVRHYQGRMRLTVTGRNIEKGTRVSVETGARHLTDNIEAVRDADIVIVSVPIAHTESVIREVWPYLPMGCLFADVTSVKEGPTRALYESAPPWVLVIPTHPMFGPYIREYEGQIVVLTPHESDRTDTRYIWLRETLRTFGFRIVETTPDEHDAMMSVVQGLTHFSLFVMGETMHRLGTDVGSSHRFSSPVYRMLLAMVSRYVGQNAGLYADIQISNPRNIRMHEIIGEVVRDYSTLFREGNRDGFVRSVEACKEHFGEQETAWGQSSIDRIVFLMGREIDRLERHRGTEVTLENIYDASRLSGILEDITDEGIRIDGAFYPLHHWVLAETSLS